MPDVQLPAYRLKHIAEVRSRLITAMMQFIGQVFDAQILDTLSREALTYLPARTPDYAIREMSRGILGRRLSADDIKLLAWRVAGNIGAIADGQAIATITPATVVNLPLVPVEVLRAWPRRTRNKKLVYDVRLIALAGPASGIEVDIVWANGIISIVGQQLGFTKTKGKMPIQDAAELVGLWFYTKFLFTEYNNLSAEGIKCPSACMQHNKEIIKIRCRIEPCPRNYKHYCYLCAVGRESCVAATHTLPFVRGVCQACHKLEAFDAERSTLMCIRCWDAARMRDARPA